MTESNRHSKSPRKSGLFLSSLLSVVVASAALVPTAEAYIPSSRTISNRVVKNHGKGIYAIEQEVQIRTADEPVILRERWVVENGENMRLTVLSPKSTSQSVHYDAVYRGGKKTAPDLKGSLRTTAVPPEFTEVFSHARSGRGLMDALVKAGIVGPSFLRERGKTVKNGNFTYSTEPLVRLGRSSGVVTWIFGEPTPVDASRAKPSAWIEQDGFLVRRVRFPSEAEVTADKYSAYAGALKLAREKTITWGGNSAVIRVVSVKPVSPAAAAQFLSPNSISSKDAQAAQLPDQAQVKEFYSRFR